MRFFKSRGKLTNAFLKINVNSELAGDSEMVAFLCVAICWIDIPSPPSRPPAAGHASQDPS